MRGFWRQPRLGQPAALARARRRASMHLATAAVVNAVWDLRAKREGKPLWKLLARLSPRSSSTASTSATSTDALPPEEALDLLRGTRRRGREHASGSCSRTGYPGLHDLGRLARLRRREGRAARARGASPTGSAREDEGRSGPRADDRRVPD